MGIFSVTERNNGELDCDGASDYAINEAMDEVIDEVNYGVIDGLNGAANDCVIRLDNKKVGLIVV